MIFFGEGVVTLKEFSFFKIPYARVCRPRNVAVHLQGLDNLDLVGAQREFGALRFLPNNFWVPYVRVIFCI